MEEAQNGIQEVGSFVQGATMSPETKQRWEEEMKAKEAFQRRDAKRDLVELLMALYALHERSHSTTSPETDDVREEVRLFLSQKLSEALPKGGKE